MECSLKNVLWCACVIVNEARALLGRRGQYPRGVFVIAMAKDADILQCFWGLSSLDEKEREGSARELLTALLNKQVCIR